MNMDQATAALRKLYGTKAAWQYLEKALKGEERETAGRVAKEANALHRSLREKMEARRLEVLRGDAVYQELKSRVAAAERAAGQASAAARHRRVTVGYMSGAAGLSFFHVTAEGDNWQEAIDAARAKEQK